MQSHPEHGLRLISESFSFIEILVRSIKLFRMINTFEDRSIFHVSVNKNASDIRIDHISIEFIVIR